eukprot:symbB.v1.2.005014.t1/scaffold288.1/size478366/44
MCQDAWMSQLWSTYLDCDFLENYLRWTTPESDWLDEAFVTYVAGPQDSIYALQAVNLIRSIDLFSTRPVVVVVFDDKFMPPAQWHGFPNVIVYKMPPMKGHHVSFNFNKLRAMVAARVLVGVQLDTDQLITPSYQNQRLVEDFYVDASLFTYVQLFGGALWDLEYRCAVLSRACLSRLAVWSWLP